ncbi:cinnamoyl-CoA reductase 2-like [Panicum miliaceum]|uniref:Cinnamoyl-CoA reductase 2-like n=1 Tax=Panicum miliaceum TaxID=4540 RepID=A0A3L6PFC9_PANMI|nr:cinnamoyl-CoA reductase 2-like [Panicum miliaceum]
MMLRDRPTELNRASKNAHLKALEGARERLQLIKADLLDYNSVVSAVAGCEGVFHVASPVPFGRSSNPEIHVEVIDPAVTGTSNVLKACYEAKVRRVVVVSSAVAVFSNPNWPKGKPFDEECWSDEEYCRKNEVEVIGPAVTGTANVLKACYEAKVGRVVVVSSVAAVSNNPNWPKGKAFDEDSWSDEEYCRKNEDWYNLSKTLAEREAFAYAEKTGLDVVTICPSLVLGPLMQSTINASSKILLNYLKGDRDTVENRLRNIMDVRDVTDALLLAYEKPEASGRYICSSHPIKVSDMINILKNLYPTYPYPKNFVEVEGNFVINSEKLQKLGWTFRPIEETLRDCVESYKAFGFLN